MIDAAMQGAARDIDAGTGLARVVLVGWVATAAILILVSATAIAGLAFPDPDDAMRLVQVRDLLSGQSWWDVDQHRLWGGQFAMHWSRLVDLPIAAVLGLLDPLVGTDWATRIAVTVVPLVTLLAIMALIARMTDRLAGREAATLAVLLTALAVPILFQARPLRIDHHGWQIVLALAATCAILRAPTARSGAAAGLALAALVTISLEGLPITAVIAGVILVGWALDPSRKTQAAAFAATLLTAIVILHIVTRGPGVWQAACDAIAPAWIAAAGIALVGSLAAIAIAPHLLAARLALLAGAGVAGILMVRLLAPGCAAGPFATLDPLVYSMWYRNISEGLPIWDQPPVWAAMNVGLPIVGLIGAGLAWRSASGEARARWALLLAIALPAFLLSLLVVRTGATANALAVPGAAVALAAMLTRARAIGGITLRTLATAGALLAASPGLVAGMALTLAQNSAAKNAATARVALPPCTSDAQLAALAQLPPATLFAPVDVTPQILATTRHRAIGAGYHRNAAAIARVFHAFLASPDRARALIVASGADYVVACPGANETDIFARSAPDGLWARLDRGERIAWLRPVPIAGSPVRAWRVIAPDGLLRRSIARP